MRVILVGAAGRMGLQTRKTLEENGETLAAAVDAVSFDAPCPRYRDIADVAEDADVILDFSHHSLTRRLVDFALSKKLPLVIATTGQNDDDRRYIESAARDIPVFCCGNMSFGVALFASLAGRVAAAFPYADVEIVETHHASKADCPSGTALMIANEVICSRGFGKIMSERKTCRKIGDVGISSLRLGERVGSHEVVFDTGLQTITLRHEAQSREVFARGAVNAAKFLCGKPAGLYGVKDILEMRMKTQ